MAQNREFLLGVIVGSAIGAAAALMYAPASGAETREQLRVKAEQARDKATEVAEQARARATEVANQARSKVEEVSREARTKVEDLSHQAQNAVDRGRQLVEGQKDAILTAVDAGKQAYRDKASELHKEVAEDTKAAV